MGNYSVLGKMTAREIVKNLLQYLSMIIITMLAVTLFCGFISNAKTLDLAIADYKKSSNLCDLCVQTTPGSIDESDKTFFESLEGATYEYRFYAEGQVNNLGAKIYVGKGEITAPLVDEGERGVLIDKKVAERNNISIGDEVNVSASGYEFKVNVTGTMNFIEVANTYSVCPLYIDEEVLIEKVSEMLGLPVPNMFSDQIMNVLYNQILVKTDDIEKTRGLINEHFSSKENNNLLYIFDASNFEAIVSLEGEVDQSLKMIYVFPVIFLLVSVLVILTTISQLILRERTNIGTLKAIGLTKGRILVHYASFGVVLCLIGGIIGAIIGPQIVTNVMQIKYNLVYSFPKMSGVVYSPIWSVIALVIITALAGIIGFTVAHSVVSERPAECMRPLPPKENILIKKIVENSKKDEKRESANNLSFKMAVRNMLIKPSRAIMTIIGIAGCVALLVCSFGIGDTVNNSVNLELKRNYNYDITSTYLDENWNELENNLESLKAEGKVTSYETYKSFYMTASGKSIKDIFVYCYKPNSEFTKINTAGKVLLSKSVAKTLGVKAGEDITLTYGGSVKNVKIDELVETALTNGLFIDTNEFDDFQHTNNIWIKSGFAEEVGETVKALSGTGSAFTISTYKARVKNMISSIDTIKLTLMLFAVALSVVVLYNLSLLNIKERTRDIATMKVLGFTNYEIGSTLLYEIMTLAIIGTAIGLALGYPIVYLVLSINRVEVLNFIYAVFPLSYLYSALISIVTALLINLLFMPVIRKINMISSLKSVE